MNESPPKLMSDDPALDERPCYEYSSRTYAGLLHHICHRSAVCCRAPLQACLDDFKVTRKTTAGAAAVSAWCALPTPGQS